MKILFQVPSLYTIFAARTIYNGYKNAFENNGHSFRILSADDNPDEVIKLYKPDLLFTGLSKFHLKYLPPDIIRKYKNNMKVFVGIGFWNSPLSKLRINETPSLSNNLDYIKLIKSGKYGDAYYNVCEQGDPRMNGFKKVTGYPYYTIPLAADKTTIFPEFAKHYNSDISFIGTYLPDKKNYFNEFVFPLQKKYNLKIYGQDWKYSDRVKSLLQKGGQYFNIPLIRSLQKAKLAIEDERKIYSSSTISINVHEEYQRNYGGDCNERTFKIPLAGGFEITDNVSCIKKYFVEGKEIIIAKNKKDWFDKIDYYIKNPEKRMPIIEAGRKKVLKDHTYDNRVKQILEIYKAI